MRFISILFIATTFMTISNQLFSGEIVTPYVDHWADKENVTNPAFARIVHNREKNKMTKEMYECVLKNLKNVGSDVAAQMIATACKALNRD